MHGFIKDISCKTQLIEAACDSTNVLDLGNGKIDIIIFEFSKACNVVRYHCLS